MKIRNANSSQYFTCSRKKMNFSFFYGNNFLFKAVLFIRNDLKAAKH